MGNYEDEVMKEDIDKKNAKKEEDNEKHGEETEQAKKKQGEKGLGEDRRARSA